MHSVIRIGLIGDFSEHQKSHRAIPRALAAASKGAAEAVWVPTDSIGDGEVLHGFHGIWCVPGMPYRSAEGALAAIRHARLTRTPFLGTSAGFQYTLIEFARNVLGFMDAGHQKTHPTTPMPLIAPLDCGLSGVKARVRFTPGSVLHSAYGVPESVEEYHCSCGLNGRYRRLIESGNLYVAAVDDQHEVRAVELEGHPLFVATLFQPELRSLEDGGRPNPLVDKFVAACQRRSQGAIKVAS